MRLRRRDRTRGAADPMGCRLPEWEWKRGAEGETAAPLALEPRRRAATCVENIPRRRFYDFQGQENTQQQEERKNFLPPAGGEIFSLLIKQRPRYSETHLSGRRRTSHAAVTRGIPATHQPPSLPLLERARSTAEVPSSPRCTHPRRGAESVISLHPCIQRKS